MEECVKCVVCHRRVKTLVECKCKQKLCKLHVQPEDHPCTFDYKFEGRRLLEKQNPKVVCEKVS